MDELDRTLIELFAAEPRVGVSRPPAGSAWPAAPSRPGWTGYQRGVITGWGPDLSTPRRSATR